MNEEQIVHEIDRMKQEIAALRSENKCPCSRLLKLGKVLIKRRVIIPLLALSLLVLATLALAQAVPNIFYNAEIISASAFNENFDYIVTQISFFRWSNLC